MTLWLSLALALPPCDDDVSADVQALRSTLEALEPEVRAVAPNIPAPEDTPFAFARDDGLWLAVGTHFPATCEADGLEVAERKLWAMPGSGSMSLFTADEGARPILAVGTHDEARDGWDRIGWQAIVVHEWTHVAHARSMGDAYPGLKARRKLTKRFARKASFRDAVVILSDALRTPCDTDPRPHLAAVRGELPTKLHDDLDAYLVVEGFARHAEVRYELAARDLPVTQDTVYQACRPLEGAEFGYPVGCFLADRVQRCGGDLTAFHVDAGRWLAD